MKTKSLSIFLVALFVVEMNLGAEEEMLFEEEKNNDDKNEKNKGIGYEIIKEEIDTYDLSLKILLIGDDNVGKSALITKICKNNFLENYISTMGFEFFTLDFRILSDNDKPVLRCQIWDCCGNELYRSLVNNFYRNTKVCLLVYDVTNEKSFNDIDVWLNTAKENDDGEIEHFVLIGTKIDLEDGRAVSKDAGKKFAKDNGMKFVEVSAKTDTGLDDLKVILAKIIYEEYKKGNEKKKENEEEEKGKVEDRNGKKSNEIIEEDDINLGYMMLENHTNSSSLCDCCAKICDNC